MYTEHEIEMARRGYCYLRQTISPNGKRKLVRDPSEYKRAELTFDAPAYEAGL